MVSQEVNIKCRKKLERAKQRRPLGKAFTSELLISVNSLLKLLRGFKTVNSWTLKVRYCWRQAEERGD